MKLHFAYTRYGNGRLAVQLFTDEGEPFATLSTNIPDVGLGANQFFMKDWSENAPVAAAVRGLGVFRDVGHRVATGYVTAWAYEAPETPPEPFEFEYGEG
jgi:hypothetical protein